MFSKFTRNLKIFLSFNNREELTNVFVGALLWIILFPLLILSILLPLTLYRLLVHFLARIFRPDLIPITNPLDNIYSLAPTPENKDFGVNMFLYWKIQGKLDTAEFRKHFYNTFLSTEKLKKTYRNYYCYFVNWMGYCFKRKVDSINLEKQIEERKLTPEEEQNLESFIAKWNNTNDFGDRNPAWKILIIHLNKCKKGEDGLLMKDGKFESLLIFKFHHGLSDGYCSLNFIDKITGTETPYVLQGKSSGLGLGKKLKSILAFPKIFLDQQQRWKRIKDIPHFIKSEILQKPNWQISFTTLDTELVKKVRRATKARFSVVVGMIQIGAIRRYLLQKGIIESEDELPDVTNISAPIGLPSHPIQREGKMANHFGLAEWKVPTGTEKSVKERIIEADADCSEMYVNGSAMLFSAFVAPLSWPLTTKMRMGLMRQEVLSNAVPSSNHFSCMGMSDEKRYLLGNPVTNIYGSFNTQHISPWMKMMVGSVTMGEEMNVSVLTPLEIFQSQADIDWFTKILMKEELNHLVSSCSE